MSQDPIAEEFQATPLLPEARPVLARTRSVRSQDGLPRARLWCFTCNNPDDMDAFKYDGLVPQGVASYVVYGREFAPHTGTPHYQGFIRFEKCLRLSDVLRVCPQAHYEVTRGTAQQAALYCKKDGDFREFGSLPAGPAATAKRDYAAIVAACKKGDLESLPDDTFFLHYGTAKRIKTDFAKPPPNLDDCCGVWFVGPPGGGKSFMARARCSADDLYLKPANKWWDSYQGQEFVLIDDFDHNHKCLGHHLKIWADRYAFPAEQKGSTIQVRPSVIMVTSNYSIDDIFHEDAALAVAIKRRFKVFIVNDRKAVCTDDPPAVATLRRAPLLPIVGAEREIHRSRYVDCPQDPVKMPLDDLIPHGHVFGWLKNGAPPPRSSADSILNDY